ncbi:MAG: acyltransferase [Methylocystis silviterrae]|uniref:acyltransferase family protein n=1 Tax=Methylocystis silviterrae TaxID=2743612 RepID=UPI003C725ABE
MREQVGDIGRSAVPRRYEALDSLRGVCACMVVLFHLKPNSHFVNAALLRHSYLFVDFFFVLSGFVIFEAYRDKLRQGFGLGPFVVLRFGRIYPLHAFLLACFVAYEIVWAFWLHRYSAEPRPSFSGAFSLNSLFESILLLDSFGLTDGLAWNYPAWSIAAEFWTYILFAMAIVAVPMQRLTDALIVLGSRLITNS